MEIEIKGIGNFYGNLHVKADNDRYYMKVFCEITNFEWREISKDLYLMLLELNKV